MDLREAGREIRHELGREISCAVGPTPLPLVVATSGGVDSASLVVAARDLALTWGFPKPTIATFRMRDRSPYDAATAIQIAWRFGLGSHLVNLPTDENETLAGICGLIKEGFRGKAAIECAWPFWYLLWLVPRGSVLVTGSAADGHYGLSKKAMINHRRPKAAFDKFREEYFAKPDRAQVASVKRLGAQYGVRVVAPYFGTRVQQIMREFSWDELNRPRQKEIVRAAFPELDQFRLRRHQNLQLGDSGIAEHVGRVAMKATGKSSPVAAYNELVRRRGVEENT